MDASPRRPGPARRLMLLLTVVVCAAAAGGCMAMSSSQPETTTRAMAQRDGEDLQSDYQSVIRDSLPSVVQIQAGDSLGSGVVYDTKGHVVTNAHVVGDAKSLRVTIATGEQTLTAKLVSSYPQQDLAVIKLDPVPEGLKPATFGDSSKVEVGHIVLAMGSPLGLSSSVTQGIVSAVGRTVSESGTGGTTGATLANNVGGDQSGQQRGRAGEPGQRGDRDPDAGGRGPAAGRGCGPGHRIRDPRLHGEDGRRPDHRERQGDRLRPRGAGHHGPDGARRQLRALGGGGGGGREGGPAEQAGLRVGDIITKVGSTEITTVTSLAEALASMNPGDKVVVGYLRDGDSRTAQVTLGEV